MQVTVNERLGTVRFPVRVQPRASRSETCGTMGGALKVRLQAPPVDGAANESLIELMAELLGVARRQVRIVAGISSRSKVVEVEGVDRRRVEALAARDDERNTG
jgi:uncharacterized protein